MSIFEFYEVNTILALGEAVVSIEGHSFAIFQKF